METKLGSWMELIKISDRILAEKMGVDRSYVCLVRTGKRPVTAAFRWRFAAAYGYDMAVSLLDDEPQSEVTR